MHPPCIPYASPMHGPWIPHAYPMDTPWIPHASPLDGCHEPDPRRLRPRSRSLLQPRSWGLLRAGPCSHRFADITVVLDLSGGPSTVPSVARRARANRGTPPARHRRSSEAMFGPSRAVARAWARPPLADMWARLAGMQARGLAVSQPLRTRRPVSGPQEALEAPKIPGEGDGPGRGGPRLYGPPRSPRRDFRRS